MKYLVTGGMGFFGSVLMEYLVSCGHDAISLDRLCDEALAGKFAHVTVDLEDKQQLEESLRKLGKLDGIFHVAAVMAHDRQRLSRLWASNVDGTGNLLEVAARLEIKRLVFTGSNCVFSTGYKEPVDETVPPKPIELYGSSKLAAEELFWGQKQVDCVSFRCPTIISAGRLGLLTILFDFVREGRRLYLVGDGSNRYSFIYAIDLADACLKAMQSNVTGVYHISSDDVPTMRQLYSALCQHAGKQPRLVNIPEWFTVPALSAAYRLGISPLGPYHYRMLAANFVLDNRKLKRDLDWAPTKTNIEMLTEAYDYYLATMNEGGGSGKSAHRSAAKAGILNLLRLIS